MTFNKIRVFYCIVGVLYIFFESFHWTIPVHIARLMLIPILFYGIIKLNRKMNRWIGLILISYFAGDIFIIYPFKEALLYIISTYGFAHIVFLILSFGMIRDINVKKLIYSALPIIILWFVYLNISLGDLFGRQLGEFYLPVLLYSIIISMFTVMALVSYFNNESNKTLYLVIIALSFVVADILLGIHEFVVPNRLFGIINVMCQIIGYYFIFVFALEFEGLDRNRYIF